MFPKNYFFIYVMVALCFWVGSHFAHAQVTPIIQTQISQDQDELNNIGNRQIFLDNEISSLNQQVPEAQKLDAQTATVQPAPVVNGT